MTLEERIMHDLKTAMKNNDDAAKRGIRAIKAAILLEKTSATGSEMNEEKEIKLLQKLVKQRRESLDIYVKGNREDLAQIEREEIAVIEKYLPQQMGEAEVEAIVQKVVETTGASGMKDMGKVMGAASKELAGKADGRMISEIVKRLLA